MFFILIKVYWMVEMENIILLVKIKNKYYDFRRECENTNEII